MAARRSSRVSRGTRYWLRFIASARPTELGRTSPEELGAHRQDDVDADAALLDGSGAAG